MNDETLTSPILFLKQMSGDLPAESALFDYQSWWQAEGDMDRQLAQVIQQDPPVLGFFFRGVGGQASELQPGRFMKPSIDQASTYNLVRWLDQKPTQLPIIGAEGVELNLPEITEAAAGGGYFNMIPDRDGTIHSYLFADAEQKGRLMGARRVEMAKPWRREIYLTFEEFPHGSLRHEIAHVVAGTFGSAGFHVAARSVLGLPLLFNPGLPGVRRRRPGDGEQGRDRREPNHAPR